jgi:16S rRNA (guanine527-N7)-methyltransferase
MNLTAITEEIEVYKKHFFDSLNITRVLDFESQRLLDVGSGAGFPSIPLKIMFPDLRVTIIDALQKRITFLRVLCDELNIEAELIHGRAEEYMRKHVFDVVTARAVANLRMLSELCIPFVRVGGKFFAMKGPKLQVELQDSLDAITILGGKVDRIETYVYDDQERSILIVDKVNKTEKKYPRAFKQIKKNPL